MFISHFMSIFEIAFAYIKDLIFFELVSIDPFSIINFPFDIPRLDFRQSLVRFP